MRLLPFILKSFPLRALRNKMTEHDYLPWFEYHVRGKRFRSRVCRTCRQVEIERAEDADA